MTDARFIHRRSRHPVIAGTVEGRRRKIVVGCSNPSDRRSLANTTAMIRRLIRQWRGPCA